MSILSKSAQLVQEALAQKNVAFSVIELSSSARTAQDAANSLGCEIAQIVKSLLFCTQCSCMPVLVLASGQNRVDEQVIEDLMGEKIIKANADFTREVTGFAIGGVPPLGHKQQIKNIFIDEELLQYETLWAAAGTPNAVFTLPSSELQKITGGQVISIKGVR